MNRAKDYLKYEEAESNWVANAGKISKLRGDINTIIQKGTMLNSHFKNIKDKVSSAITNQQHEYMSSVNNSPNYGIDASMNNAFSIIHFNTD